MSGYASSLRLISGPTIPKQVEPGAPFDRFANQNYHLLAGKKLGPPLADIRTLSAEKQAIFGALGGSGNHGVRIS
jgi:hypothetical protein